MNTLGLSRPGTDWYVPLLGLVLVGFLVSFGGMLARGLFCMFF